MMQAAANTLRRFRARRSISCQGSTPYFSVETKMSSSERANYPQAPIPGQFVSARCRGYVLNACPRTIEDRNFIVSQPPWPMLRNKGAKFGAHIRRCHYTGVDCMVHVAHDDTLLEYVNDHGRFRHQLGLDFTLLWIVSAHCAHKRSRSHVVKAEERRARGRAGHDCIADQCSLTQIINGSDINSEFRRHLG